MKVIGLSGVAGSGKDTFFSILQQKIDCKRISLADELKEEVRNWCIEHYQIDPVSCTREQKEVIRSFLVFHGMQKRKRTNGRHWIDKLHKKISLLNHVQPEPDTILVVTDIRYCDYEQDELFWLKQQLNGILVHVSLYEEKEVVSKKEWPKIKTNKIFVPPANLEESRNDPKIKSAADYVIEWPKITCKSTPELHENLRKHVEEFVEWMKNQ